MRKIAILILMVFSFNASAANLRMTHDSINERLELLQLDISAQKSARAKLMVVMGFKKEITTALDQINGRQEGENKDAMMRLLGLYSLINSIQLRTIDQTSCSNAEQDIRHADSGNGSSLSDEGRLLVEILGSICRKN